MDLFELISVHDSVLSELTLQNLYTQLTSNTLANAALDDSKPPCAITLGHLINFRNKVFSIALSSHSTSSHQSAACSVICALLKRYNLHDCSWIKLLYYDELTMKSLFNVFLQCSTSCKSQILSQILNSLTSLLISSSLNDLNPSNILNYCVDVCLARIIIKNEPVQLKPAFQLLYHFLSNNLTHPDHLISRLPDSLSIPDLTASQKSDKTNLLQLFFSSCLSCFKFNNTPHSATKFIKLFIEKLEYDPYSEPLINSSYQAPLWVKPFAVCLTNCIESLNFTTNDIISQLFVKEPRNFILALHFVGLSAFFCLTSCDARGSQLHMLNFHTRSNAVHTSPKFPVNKPPFLLLSKLLRSGVTCGLVTIADPDESPKYNHPNLVSGQLIIPHLVWTRSALSYDSEVREVWMDILMNKSSLSQPLSRQMIKLLRIYLNYFITDTDANSRNSFINFVRELINRMRFASAALIKSSRNLVKSNHDIQTLNHPPTSRYTLFSELQLASSKIYDIAQFLSWLHNFVIENLAPGIPYHYRITSLRIFILLLKCGIDSRVPAEFCGKINRPEILWPFSISIVTVKGFLVIKDLLTDPFEDIRESAHVIVRIHLQCGIPVQSSISISKCLEDCQSLFHSTARADHGDGLARWYTLIGECCISARESTSSTDIELSFIQFLNGIVKKLDLGFDLANRSLPLAVKSYPLHGYLMSISRAFETLSNNSSLISGLKYTDLLLNVIPIVKIFMTTWSLVGEILCNDAPEGYLPNITEPECRITTKDVLSYAWRAYRELSILFRSYFTFVIAHMDSDQSMLRDILKQLSNECFEQLFMLRHKGAISVASETFECCCNLLKSTSFGPELFNKWYDYLLKVITSSDLIVTRRSAGLPAMVIGLLQAGSSAFFERVINDLIELSSTSSVIFPETPNMHRQVHALNCLNAIIKSSSLRELSQPFIHEMLKLISNLDSHAWSIRNSLLMLIRSIIDRLIGVNNSSITRSGSSNYFEKFPFLLDIICTLLLSDSRVSWDSTHAEAIFLSLHVLQRSYNASTRSFIPDSIISSVINLTGHSHWHIRNMSAQTYARLSQLSLDSMTHLIMSHAAKSCNSLHGKFLTLVYIAKSHNYITSSIDFQESIASQLLKFASVAINSQCPPVIEAFTSMIVAAFRVLNKSIENTQMLIQLWSVTCEFRRIADLNSSNYTLILQDLVQLRSLEFLRAVQFSCFQLSTLTYFTDPVNRQAALDSLLHQLSVLHRLDSMVFCAALSCLREYCRNLKYSSVLSNPQHNYQLFQMLTKFTFHCSNTLVHTALIKTLHSLLSLDLHVSVSIDQNNALENYLASLFDFACCPTFRNGHAHLLTNSSQLVTILKTWSIVLNISLDRSIDLTPSQLHSIHSLSVIMVRCIDENVNLCIRRAAVTCLSNIPTIFCKFRSHCSVLPILLTLNDMLHDDDEIVRKTACQIVTTVSDKSILQTPLIASQTLLNFVLKSHSQSNHLFDYALSQLLGLTPTYPKTFRVDPSGILWSCTFFKSLLNFQNDRDSLFAVERQNLFVNDVFRTKFWTKILKKFTLSAVHGDLIFQLVPWITKVLNKVKLIVFPDVQFQDDNSYHPFNSSLRSRSDFFVLLHRLLNFSDILIKWFYQFPDLLHNLASSVQALIQELYTIYFLIQHSSDSLHPLLIEKLESTLKTAIRLKFFHVIKLIRNNPFFIPLNIPSLSSL